ncbi:hypothetical protein ES319_1Z070600v1 [Gossypium barbadense]|uniref:Uncharacterized protein n=1 Tax=Gossypium barbadense TaxID=3634 RepID=A0A5J5NB18_GOSBA|nr:hypothetical protein ES319_1Z070600v1 [Gossypium barbadense]KAB1669158.1 hypothetical protein ES319_1Z070600v1 [Gossypium barbadense]
MCLTYIPLLIRKKKERERVRERDGENMFDYLTIWDDYMRYILQVDVKRSMDKGEKRFNQLSIEERGKFDEETLVNVSNIRRLSTTFQKASVFNNEYIVATFSKFLLSYIWRMIPHTHVQIRVKYWHFRRPKESSNIQYKET